MMKRTLLLLVVAALAPAAVPARADEDPQTQLEFARRLREKRLADLALEYLEKLKKDPPEGLAAALPMELARTRVSLARQKEPEQRQAFFAAARKDLEG